MSLGRWPCSSWHPAVLRRIRATASAQRINLCDAQVLVVGSLTAKDVVVSGKNALAVVSDGDIAINGTFTASAHGAVQGPGSFNNEDRCKGHGPPPSTYGGSGGGGFGSFGGTGGLVGRGDYPLLSTSGAQSGTVSLIPLRGGCDGGEAAPALIAGAAGGAIQLVSRSQIVVSGVISANGSGGVGGGDPGAEFYSKRR